MSAGQEPPLLALLLFPFRLIVLLADLAVRLSLLVICGALLVLTSMLLWTLLLHGP